MKTPLISRKPIIAALLLSAGPLASVMSAANAPTDAVVRLEEFHVEGFRREYFAPHSSTGLGLEADLMATPLTVVSIPMDILTDQQVNNVEDALRNIAAVSKFKQGNGGEEKFSIRGFDAAQNLYKDGARINNLFNATNIATTETANIERYDMLKGPAAILYGQGEPGGVINYVTKKPLFDPYRGLEVMVGNYDYYRGELDLTGPLSEHFAYRAVASYEDSGSHRDYHFRERLLLAPSLTWRLTDATSITAQIEVIDDRYTQDRGQVLDGDNISGFHYSDRLDPTQFFGVPGFNEKTNSEFRRFAILASHRFNDRFTTELNASTSRVKKRLFDSSPRNSQANLGVVAAIGDVVIRPGGQGGTGESDTVQWRNQLDLDGAEIAGKNVRHRLMLLTDYERIFNDAKSYPANVSSVVYNVHTRTYTGIPEGGVQLGSPPNFEFITHARQWGLTLQDLVSIGDNLHLLAGARYTRFHDREEDITASDLSERVGFVWQAGVNTAVYANYARGFVPTTASDRNGDPLDPETTAQMEIGARWQLSDGGLMLNAAVFDLRKQNIAVTDPASIDQLESWAINGGETRTRGFELQAVGRLSPALRLIAGYAYLDNELISVTSERSDTAGNALPGIPPHSGNAWAVYEFERGRFNGLGLGAGVFAQSKVFASIDNRAIYDGWTQLDAVVYYKRDRWKLQVNFKNLTDETYNLTQALIDTDDFAAVRVGTSTPFTATFSIATEF